MEPSIRKNIPPVLYKYRDWSDKYHRLILTDNCLWFAAPSTLDDPYDIRVRQTFDKLELLDPAFFKKIEGILTAQFPHIPPGSREFQVLCENKFAIIKQNPSKWFQTEYERVRQSGLFDSFGVLSLAKNPLVKEMWNKYTGKDGQGFCIGFDAVELARVLHSVGHGLVHYQAKRMVHSFLYSALEQEIAKQFVKEKKWKYQEEYRFITLGVKTDDDRIRRFPKFVAREILLDGRMSQKHKKEITSLLREKFDSRVLMFNVQWKRGKGFMKTEIKY